jgi:hypothetical protein
MVKSRIKTDEVCSRFSEVRWHDSKLLDLCLLKDNLRKRYDMRLSLDLIIGWREGIIERSKKNAYFRECRILKTDLDLLGVLICGGDIASATCYADAVELEKGSDKVRQFGFPQNHNPLEDCLGFLIEMINPGGEIIVFARNFELV